MNRELDKKLCADYPKMFVNRNKSIQESCMSWGFECGDGWYDLINQLCSSIQRYIDQNQHLNIPQVTVEQVKEKYGTLRFYTHGGDQLTDGMIWFAENLSSKTCEVCGNKGELINDSGWYVTLCKEHQKERNIIEAFDSGL